MEGAEDREEMGLQTSPISMLVPPEIFAPTVDVFCCLQHACEQADTLKLVTRVESPPQPINVNYWH